MSLDIIKKLEKSGYSTMALSAVVSEDKSPLRTPTPIINFAVSGYFDGGLPSGTTVLAGPSSSFKTALLLFYIKSFQKAFPKGVVFFLDTESGSNYKMMKNFGIDMDRVIYLKPKHMHELHHELQKIVDEKTSIGDEVMIAVDSIGSVATASEMERAKKDKITTDMGGRAKELKALFRTTSPFVQEKNIYAVYLNHTYDTPEMFSERMMSGGSGPMYDAQTVIFLDKVKLPKELMVSKGDNRFNVLVYKSRRLIDRVKFYIDVYQKTGMDKISYLDELAKSIVIEHEGVQKQLLSHYHGAFWDYIDFDTLTGAIDVRRITKAELYTPQFWAKMLTNPLFIKGAEDLYVINIDATLEEDEDDIFALIDSINAEKSDGEKIYEDDAENVDSVKKSTKTKKVTKKDTDE